MRMNTCATRADTGAFPFEGRSERDSFFLCTQNMSLRTQHLQVLMNHQLFKLTKIPFYYEPTIQSQFSFKECLKRLRL